MHPTIYKSQLALYNLCIAPCGKTYCLFISSSIPAAQKFGLASYNTPREFVSHRPLGYILGK